MDGWTRPYAMSSATVARGLWGDAWLRLRTNRVVLIALGLIERDGAAIGVGLGLTVAALVFFALVASGLSYAGHQLLAATG